MEYNTEIPRIVKGNKFRLLITLEAVDSQGQPVPLPIVPDDWTVRVKTMTSAKVLQVTGKEGEQTLMCDVPANALVAGTHSLEAFSGDYRYSKQQAFVVVEWSADAGLPTEQGEDIEVQTIEVRGTLSIGGGGTSDYEELENKPKINGVELIGDKSGEELGLDNKTIHVTYAELKALRDGAELIEGRFYRITDYVATCTQENARAVEHPFDIVVVADSADTLNENARAVRHEGDTYFEGVKLEAFELKYCLDNDTTRFAWADAENGKGVIYYMKDDLDNECGYDFKSIQFKRWKITASAKGVTELVGKYMAYSTSMSGFTIDANDWIWCYTFSSDNSGGEQRDYSLHGKDYYVMNNHISDYLDEEGVKLNNIVFFGNDCYSNTFGNYCNYNTFGNSCSSNTFGNDCYSNTFGNDCHSNTFGNYCSSNTFGNYCNYNTFGNDCPSNTFGNYCNSNTFGNACYSNTFGNDCSSNTFGNDCNSNTFGNRVGSTRTTIDNVRYMALGDGAKYLNIECADTSSNYLQNVKIAQGLQGTSSQYLTITIPDRNLPYETRVAKNSNGDVKIYCEADLIN